MTYIIPLKPVATDGHQILSHLLGDDNEPEGLGACNGHETVCLGYHYHAGQAGANAILGCHVTEADCAFANSAAVCDATVRPPRP